MNTKNYRIKSWIIVFVFLFEVIFSGYVPVSAAESGDEFTGASGVSQDLDWSIDENGHLKVSGEGEFSEGPGKMPKWLAYKDYIVTAEIDVANIKNMSYMFYQCEKMKSIDFKDTDTSQTRYTYRMFVSCSALESLDLSGFDTSLVMNMMEMFMKCKSLKSITFGDNFKTNNVENMFQMFAECNSLESLDLRGFQTNNVETMYNMFKDCYGLKTLDLRSFNTENLTRTANMFYGCKNLESIQLGGMNTSKVTDMSQMFYGCKSLQSIDLSGFDTSKAEEMSYMFSGCHSIKHLDLSNFSFESSTLGADEPFVLKMDGLETLTTGKDKRLYTLKTTAKGWRDDAWTRYADDEATEFEANTTLYRLLDSYKLNYVYEGELVDCPDAYELDVTLPLSGYVELPNYTFDGWYEDEELTQKITEITAGRIGDITLYAKMLPNSYNIIYKNTDGADGVKHLPTGYTYGTSQALPQISKTCYIFDGWYLDEKFTDKISEISSSSVGDLTVYAKWTEKHDLDKSKGVIVKEATTVAEGEICYSCKNCTYTETESIPRKVTQESQVTDETIMDTPDDGEVKGSDFTKFQARAVKTTKNTIKLKWNKIEGVDGYKIYANKCGKKYKYKLVKNVKGEEKISWTHKKRKKGTYYKYVVRAYKVVGGQEITLAVSKTIHVTTAGGKKGNAKAVVISTDKKMKKTSGAYTLTLKKNKKYTIKASEKRGSKKISRHRKIYFVSTDKKVATVSLKKGVVKAKSKGTCYIYVYAQNGVYKKIKVVVK